MDTTELDALVAQLRGADVKDDARFSELFSKAYGLLFQGVVGDKELAARFGMSRSTITRWRSGVTTPHPAMRKPVYSFLLNKASARITAASIIARPVAGPAVRSGVTSAPAANSSGGLSRAPSSLPMTARSRG
jgi:transcriptional regulator with XRE-family HTH domain